MKNIFYSCMILAMLLPALQAWGQDGGGDSASHHEANVQVMYDAFRQRPTLTAEAYCHSRRQALWLSADVYPKHTDMAEKYPFDGVGASFYTEVGYTFYFRPKANGWGLHAEWNGGYFVTNTLNNNFEYIVAYLAGVEYMRVRPNGHRYIHRWMCRHERGLLRAQYTFEWELPNLFGLEGLAFSGFLDFWAKDTYYGFDSEEESYKQSFFTLRTELQLRYNLSHLWNKRPTLGREGLEAFLTLKFSEENPFGWHYGKDYHLNYGGALTPCLGLSYAF